TSFVGAVDETAAGDLLERCRAFLFCAEEDFGIAPVEANAHGAPCVALARGGILETMTSETAVLFERAEVNSLASAIESALGRRWNEAALKANAARFSAPRFRDEFAEVVRG